MPLCADDFASKLTIGVYSEGPDTVYDLNLRHQTGNWTNWIGTFVTAERHVQGRIGSQYNWQHDPVLVQASLQTGTTHFLVGQLYSELGGGEWFGIGGYSRTNLREQNDLTFDPNDSGQIGAGFRRGNDRVAVYTIRDIRLHTRQQHTHAIWRRRLTPTTAVTFDSIYISGLTDSGRFVHTAGGGIYVDHAWFAKLYYDPTGNFSDRRQVRLSFGKKF